jgi:hypothetical protein
VPTICVIGSLDTKGRKVTFVRNRILGEGQSVLIVDVGVLGEPTIPVDVCRDAAAKVGGACFAGLPVGRRPRTGRRNTDCAGASARSGEHVRRDDTVCDSSETGPRRAGLQGVFHAMGSGGRGGPRS